MFWEAPGTDGLEPRVEVDSVAFPLHHRDSQRSVGQLSPSWRHSQDGQSAPPSLVMAAARGVPGAVRKSEREGQAH